MNHFRDDELQRKLDQFLLEEAIDRNARWCWKWNTVWSPDFIIGDPNLVNDGTEQLKHDLPSQAILAFRTRFECIGEVSAKAE